jgi:hypothetical protein
MTQFLKESTAVDVLIGPFVDLTNAATAETGESPSVKLSKNGQTLAAKNDVTTPVHDADGYYNCELDATDTNTVGNLVLTVAASANALPVRHEFQVIETAVYDALYASGAPGYLQPTVAGNTLDVNAAGEAGLDLDNTSGTIAAAQIAANAIGASQLATDAVDEIADGVWDEALAGHVGADSAGLVLNDWQDAGRLDAILDTIAADVVNIDGLVPAIAGDAMTLTAAATSAQLVDDIWDEALADHIAADSFGLAAQVLRANVATAGAAGTITLDAGASATADLYNGAIISLVSGTGAGQSRRITDYSVTTQIASVEPNWITNPASGTEFVIRGGGNADLRTATQTSIDAIETDTNSLNDTKIPDALNTTVTGNIGIDWANVENPTSPVDLSGTDIQLVDTTTTNTDMRGTDNAALASVVGALADAAAAGDPTSADTLMQYVKQLINILTGTTGITTMPAAAAPANNVSIAEMVRAIYDDTNSLDGTKIPDTISLANINGEVVDVITVDSISEIAQGVPSSTPNLADAVMLMYMALRNKLDVATSGTDTLEIHNDAGTRITQKLLSDDGSDYSEAKMTSGA